MSRNWLSSITVVCLLGFALPAFCAKPDDFQFLAKRVQELGAEALKANQMHMQTHTAISATILELIKESTSNKRKRDELERKVLSLETRIGQLEARIGELETRAR